MKRYDYNSNPPENLVEQLPVNLLLTWPGYPTVKIERNIGGQDVVIQLWKGWCPSYLPGVPRLEPDAPQDKLKTMFRDGGVGGIGAEVGIYRKKRPGDPVWFPNYENKRRISFRLINPKNGESLVTADPETCWWRHRWMTFASYDQYAAKNPTPKFREQPIIVSAFGKEIARIQPPEVRPDYGAYVLKFKIDDFEGTW